MVNLFVFYFIVAGEWPCFHHDLCNTGYQDELVGCLTNPYIKWSWSGEFAGSPAIVDIDNDSFIPSLNLSSYPSPFYGECVQTLIEGDKSPGSYTINWEPEELSSGIYFAKLRANGEFCTRKLLFTKIGSSL